MDEKLYEKVLDVLSLGYFSYLDRMDKLEKTDEIALDLDLRNDYSTEDVFNVICELVAWQQEYRKKNKED